jgi:hypothetical protein
MQVKVSKIMPNPFRDLENYPVLQSEIEKKKASINKTGFWDNVMAREHPDKKGYFQLAYGHTRIEAVKALEIKEINLIVKEISDADMIHILADENKEDDDDPSRVNETVSVVRKYLNDELSKYDTYEEYERAFISKRTSIDLSIPKSKTRNATWNRIKDKGIGAETIRDFLGNDWSQSMISEALATLRDAEPSDDGEEPKIDIKAIEKFPNTSQATAFRQAVKTYGVKKPEQKKLAETIIANRKKPSDGSTKEVKEAVQKAVIEKKKSTALTKVDKNKIERDAELEELKELIEEVGKSVNSTNSKITKLLSKLNEMKVSTLSGLEITENDIYCGILVDTLIEFSPYLSFNISKEDK